MTIARVQNVTLAVPNEQTSAVVTLTSTPTYRNTLVALIGQQSDANPIASSITQTGLTWSRIATSVRTGEAAVEVWAAQNVPVSAGVNVTVTLNQAKRTSIAVAEYSGLVRIGTLVDQIASANEDSQSPTTGQTTSTTQAAELWLGGLAARPDDSVYTLPSNGFSAVTQAVSSWPNNRELHVRFDGLTETVAFRDTSNNGVAIYSTSTGGVLFGQPGATSKSATSVKFTATSDGVAYGPDADFRRAAGSLALRFRATLPVSNGHLLSASNAGGTESVALTISSGLLTMSHFSGPSVTYSASTALGDGNWHEIVGTWSEADDKIRLLVDGTELGNASGLSSWTPGFDILYAVGRSTPLSANAVLGWYDDARIMRTTDWTLPIDNVRLGVYERIVSAIGQADVTVQTDALLDWAGVIVTLMADLSAEYSRTASLSTYLVDVGADVLDVNVLIAATQTRTSNASVNVSPALYNWLQVIIDNTARFANLDVLVDPQTRYGAALDVAVHGFDEPRVADLDVFLSLSFTLLNTLNVHVKAKDVRIHTHLDVPILVLPAVSNVATTPEDWQYRACRPLWCNVPKMHKFTTPCDVNVGISMLPGVDMDLTVQTEMTRSAMLQVLIAPEP